MYDFLVIFGMHCTYMWFLGYDLSLAWKFAWIEKWFFLTLFMDNYGVIGLFPLVFLVGSHVPYGCGLSY